MCKTPSKNTPAQQPPPADTEVTDPAQLVIARPKTGSQAGVRGLTIQRKTP